MPVIEFLLPALFEGAAAEAVVGSAIAADAFAVGTAVEAFGAGVVGDAVLGGVADTALAGLGGEFAAGEAFNAGLTDALGNSLAGNVAVDAAGEAFNAGLTDALGNATSGAGEAFNAGLTDSLGNAFPAPETIDFSKLPGIDSGTGLNPLAKGEGFLSPSGRGAIPNLPQLGGGQGLVVPSGSVLGDAGSFINDPSVLASAPSGYLSEAGFTSANTLSSLGDPKSFINNGSLPKASKLSAPKSSSSGSSAGNLFTQGNALLSNSKEGALAGGFLGNYTLAGAPMYNSGSAQLMKELAQLYPNAAYAHPQTMASLSKQVSSSQDYKKGGLTHLSSLEHIPEFITGATGHYVKGRGDGQSDDIPAMLADGEYVFDADTVAALGNGSSDAGAKRLDEMRQSIRKHRRSAPIDKIPPKAKSPLEYLKG